MGDYVWCFQLFDFNRMCSDRIPTWYWYPRLGHTPFLTWYWYPRLGHTPFLTWYSYPKLGHAPFLSVSRRSLMFAYHPIGAYPFFHLYLSVWFLAYSSHLFTFPRCHTKPYPLSFWVVYSLSPLAPLRHCVRSPYFFSGTLASCPNLLYFGRLSSIVSGSLIFSAALQHRVQIPYLFGSSPASCPDPLSFWQLSGIVSRSPIFRQLFGIMFGSPIFSMAFWHRVWIPYLFDGSPILLVTLQHRVQIPYLFDNSSASCPDPLFFRQLSIIVCGSSIFSAILRHHIRILYCFGGSPTSCPDPLLF